MHRPRSSLTSHPCFKGYPYHGMERIYHTEVTLWRTRLQTLAWCFAPPREGVAPTPHSDVHINKRKIMQRRKSPLLSPCLKRKEKKRGTNLGRHGALFACSPILDRWLPRRRLDYQLGGQHYTPLKFRPRHGIALHCVDFIGYMNAAATCARRSPTSLCLRLSSASLCLSARLRDATLS